MTQSQIAVGQNANISNINSKKYVALEDENSRLNLELNKQETICNELKEDLKKFKKRYEKIDQEYLVSQETVLNLNKKIIDYENNNGEEGRLKNDLELELDLLTKGRAEMIKKMEIIFRDKNSVEINLLQNELLSLKKNNKNDINNNNNNHNNDSNNKNKSNTINNNNNNDNNNNKLIQANIEIQQLKTIITNLKNSSKNNSFLQSYSTSSLSPGMIATVPKGIVPKGIVPNNKGSGTGVVLSANLSPLKSSKTERRWSLSDTLLSDARINGEEY